MTTKERQKQEKKINNIFELVKKTINEDKDQKHKKNIIAVINNQIFLYNVCRISYEQAIAYLTKVLLDYKKDFNIILNALKD